MSVQYGANQPEYDLIASKNDRFLKLSVKGSQDGGWGLIQSYKRLGVTYAEAASAWADAQSPKLVYCLVQFKNRPLGTCPDVYLATPAEIAAHLTASRNDHGNTILYTVYTYKKGVAVGFSEELPSAWRFSLRRLEQLFADNG